MADTGDYPIITELLVTHCTVAVFSLHISTIANQ